MHEVGRVSEVPVAGHGESSATFLGCIPVSDVRVGDYVGMKFMGGLLHLVARIGDMKWGDAECVLVIDWNGFRDGRPGGSMIPDDVPVSAVESCREVWRPLICEYCDRQASFIQRDGSEILCGACAKEQYSKPIDWVKPLTRWAYEKQTGGV